MLHRFSLKSVSLIRDDIYMRFKQKENKQTSKVHIGKSVRRSDYKGVSCVSIITSEHVKDLDHH